MFSVKEPDCNAAESGESPARALTVVDLFCGAGGFSEGFRQRGFHIVYAMDSWDYATRTFKSNHPDVEVVKADITNLPVNDVPRADVVIGGPPCTEFSSSNPGGRDVESGMALVLRFLCFVYALRPRWWIMENVPSLLKTLPRRIPLRRLGVEEEDHFEIPRMAIFNAADFGVPQKRLRLFSGLYPDPIQTHARSPISSLEGRFYGQWIPMKCILEALPDPLGSPSAERSVRDPLYGTTLSETELQDHFGDSCLMTREEAERNMRQKMNHPYYGKMRFPDNPNEPARTVMATQIKSSREAMVIETRHDGARVYRQLTVRECASLQCYPIGYRFSGSSLATKYRLVGNSVPTRLAAAVARAILAEAGGLSLESIPT